MIEAIRDTRPPDAQIGCEPPISTKPEYIRGQITFSYKGRLTTCYGNNGSEGSHSPECQERISNAQDIAKRNLIRVLLDKVS